MPLQRTVPCNQRRRERGCSVTFHSSGINWTSRAAVHNSVAKRCSVGLPRSHRSVIFSWACVSFPWGRPGLGRAAKDIQPCRQKLGHPSTHATAIDTKEVGNLADGVSVSFRMRRILESGQFSVGWA